MANNAVTTVLQTVQKTTIVKKPYSEEQTFGLLKLSRDDIRVLYKKFSDTFHYKDFGDEFQIVTSFEYDKNCYYDALSDIQFNDALNDDADITGIWILAYRKVDIEQATVSGIDIDKKVPASLALSYKEAKFTVRLINSGEINANSQTISNCNDHLVNLRDNVTKFLNTKLTITNRFMGVLGVIPATLLSGLFAYSGMSMQKGPTNGIEMYLLLIVSFVIGYLLWLAWVYASLQSNHVVFISKKPGPLSRLNAFYVRNKSLIDTLIAGIISGVIVALVAWAIGLIHITF